MYTTERYIIDVYMACRAHDSHSLSQLFTINPPKNASDIANFHDPNDFELYQLPEKFKPLVRSYIRLMRSIHVDREIDKAFENFLAFMGDFNRAAEVETNWVCPALIKSSNELLSVHQVRSNSKTKAENDEALEKVSTVINRSFKICLTDKSVDPTTSKKSCIHFFLASLIKIYFKLDHIELAKSMEKALLGTGSAIPTIINSPVEYRKHVVTYLYYSSLLSLDDSQYAFAEVKLITALEFLSCYNKQQKVKKQAEKLFMLVVPLRFLSSRQSLQKLTYDAFPNVRLVYKDNVIKAVKQGNLAAFDAALVKFQKVFLNRHIYLLILKLKHLCQLSLARKTARFYASVAEKTPHIVPLAYFQTAFAFSQSHDREQKEDVSLEQMECILANLISQKLVKGYLSHSNKCIVLSKTDPFPSA